MVFVAGVVFGGIWGLAVSSVVNMNGCARAVTLCDQYELELNWLFSVTNFGLVIVPL